MFMERLTRRPPLSRMPRQFWNESLTSRYGGIVVMVLSQLRTFTVFSVTSITVPSAPYLGIAIQSPTFSISLAESCTPETNPIIESLNTSIRIAAEAPNPANSDNGDLSIRILTTTIAPTNQSITWTVCNIPFKGRSRSCSFSLYTA